MCIIIIALSHIRVASYGRQCVSVNRYLGCLFNSLFKPATNNFLKVGITHPLWGNLPVTGSVRSQKDSEVESVPLPWRHHDYVSRPLAFCYKPGPFYILARANLWILRWKIYVICHFCSSMLPVMFSRKFYICVFNAHSLIVRSDWHC